MKYVVYQGTAKKKNNNYTVYQRTGENTYVSYETTSQNYWLSEIIKAILYVVFLPFILLFNDIGGAKK